MNALGIIDTYPLIVLTAKGGIDNIAKAVTEFHVKNYFIKSDYSLESILETIKRIIGE
jgi:hypothetical protein